MEEEELGKSRGRIDEEKRSTIIDLAARFQVY
jgi:hypothetical protein